MSTLSFAVFAPDGTPAQSFRLRHAHLFGTDDIPAQAEISYENGIIKGSKSGPEAAGLCLQIEVPAPLPIDHAAAGVPGLPGKLPAAKGSLGLLMLQTCLLPPRDEPYILGLELARHRIMLFLNKLEEWALFDLPAEHPVMAQFEAARLRFSAALVASRDGSAGDPRAKADRLAWQALALALDASERLALVHAERQIPLRLSGGLYAATLQRFTALTGETPPAGAAVVLPGQGTAVVSGLPQLGCAINPQTFAEPLQKVVSACCDFVTMPVRWNDLEPTEGKYNFASTDRWIEWAVRTAKLPLVAGPLLDLRACSVPEWLYIWENDYETLRDLVVEHIQQVVTRYRRTIARWTVAGGLNVNANLKLSYEQILDLTKICAMLVRKIHPAARIQLEVQQPFGEYFALDRKSLPPTFYAETALSAGLGLDAIGLRIHLGAPQPGTAMRDLAALSALLDRFSALEKPLAITAVGVPSTALAASPDEPVKINADGDDDDDTPTRAGPPAEAGYWRAPFTDQHQADWLHAALSVILSKPAVQSICWQDLADTMPSARTPEMFTGGLVAPSGQPKAAAHRLALLRQAVRDARVLL